MTPGKIGHPGSPVLWTLCTLVLWFTIGCIDVGHDAETGCLVDRTLPGCHPPQQDGGTAGAPASAQEPKRGEGGSSGTSPSAADRSGSAGAQTAGAAGDERRGADAGGDGGLGPSAH